MKREWDIFPGYELFGKNEPHSLEGGDDQIVIVNRDFDEVDGILDFLPSRAISERIAQGKIPVSVLDVGGGWKSKATSQLARRFGVDVSVTNLDILFPRGVTFGRVKAVLGDASSMPVASESQDVVYSTYVFTYFSEARSRAALSEIARVLKPGGVAFILEDIFCKMPKDDTVIQELEKTLGLNVIVHEIPELREKYPDDKLLILQKPQPKIN